MGMSGCRILETVKQDGRYVVFASNDEVYVIAHSEPMQRWTWHSSRQNGPWCVNWYKNRNDCRAHLARWLYRHTLTTVDCTTGEGYWFAPKDKFVEYP